MATLKRSPGHTRLAPNEIICCKLELPTVCPLMSSLSSAMWHRAQLWHWAVLRQHPYMCPSYEVHVRFIFWGSHISYVWAPYVNHPKMHQQIINWSISWKSLFKSESLRTIKLPVLGGMLFELLANLMALETVWKMVCLKSSRASKP